DGSRRLMTKEEFENPKLLPEGSRIYRLDNLKSQGSTGFEVEFDGKVFSPGSGKVWKTHAEGMGRLKEANRITNTGTTLGYIRYFDDFPFQEITNIWTDTITGSFTEDKIYVV